MLRFSQATQKYGTAMILTKNERPWIKFVKESTLYRKENSANTDQNVKNNFTITHKSLYLKIAKIKHTVPNIVRKIGITRSHLQIKENWNDLVSKKKKNTKYEDGANTGSSSHEIPPLLSSEKILVNSKRLPFTSSHLVWRKEFHLASLRKYLHGGHNNKVQG